MADIDEFATTLLEEAKRFLELARDANCDAGKMAKLHASLLLGMCSLEAHLNAIGEEMSNLGVLATHERALLLEKEVVLDDGAFVVTRKLKMARIDDRLQFLHSKFGKPIDKNAGWWPELLSALKLRNALSHPKEKAVITEDTVRRAIEAIIAALSSVYLAVYKVRYPYENCGLHSQISF